jgi:dihydrodipicolinate synthase/N-acetylneuraminate lyase
MNLTKQQWTAAMIAMGFKEADEEVEIVVKALAGEYATSSEEEQKELLESVLNDVDNLLPVLTVLREKIATYLEG